MDRQRTKLKSQLRRKQHVRRKIVGTPERPRLTVFRSSKHIYAQLIDDLNQVTLASASTAIKEIKEQMAYGGNVKAASAVGKKLAELAKAKGIGMAAFDRGHYKFHGRVKALADAADAAGLKFRDPAKKPKKVKAVPEKAAAPAAKPVKAEKAAPVKKPAKAKPEA